MKKTPKKILIMGLPGAGKTTLAEKFAPMINAVRINADEVRKMANDWDFSLKGRLRQSKRMKDLAQKALNEGRHVVADFVCPTPDTRKDFNADATEFINWNFEYENDCLRAALEFNRTFYKDRDVEPDDEIFINLTFVPFGQFNSPAIQTLK